MLLIASAIVALAAGAVVAAGSKQAAAAQAEALKVAVPGTTVTFEMVPVPGGPVTVDGKATEVAPLYIGRTEVTWDLYDVYALGLDKGAVAGASGADAVARPSSPYGAPDYGWGHAGFPVISLTRAAAENFAKWLSARTGRAFRLPTEAEWQHVATLAAGGATLSSADRDALAWHRGNADARTHPVARKRADRLGLFDLFGNAGEWVTTTNDALVLRGGSFRDAADAIGPAARAVQDDTWNERDPQLPKSRWWLSDGPFAGLRLVTGR
jgi:formylglycine-generating enzyme required for sulfatase activity